MNIEKDLILFVNKVTADNIGSVKQYAKKSKKKIKIAVIRDSKAKKPADVDEQLVNVSRGVKEQINVEQFIDILLTCDFQSTSKIAKTLMPYSDRLLAVVSRGEAQVPAFAKIIPHIPYVKAPTTESLKWATDKVMMRQLFRLKSKKIAPRFKVIEDYSNKTLELLKKEVGFPMIIKPAELDSSLLVNICFHKEELQNALSKSFKKISKIYKENNRKTVPQILAEEYMEGDMYSIDAYVNSKGSIYFCPLVSVKTGKQIGFDDFFGYMRITPTKLSKKSTEEAEEVAAAGIKALGLRSTTTHIELMKMEDGWKIIEIGPRIGGFRHVMYKLSFGINHGMNDMLIRIAKKPEISKKVKGYTAAFKFYCKKEGIIKKLSGLKKVQELKSLYSVKQNKKVGDRAAFAKNGGKSVCDVVLFNKDRSALLADVRRLEKLVVIEV